MNRYKHHRHKNDDDAFVVDFIPIKDTKSNNYQRLHGHKPERYIQEIKAIQKMARKEAEDEVE